MAVLGLLSLFTHNHLYWVIGLFLALIDLPDFGTPLRRIAGSVDKLAGVPPEPRSDMPDASATHAGGCSRTRRRSAPPRARCRVMLEIILCSLVTILPDYLYRRYRQGKRIGHEITLFSVWFELRFGIITCLMLAVALITMIFYFHPSTTSATLFYRTVPIIPETIGRVAEVHVDFSAPVKKGDVIFRLDNSKQQAALERPGSKIAEVDAAMLAAQADIMKAEGQLQESKGSLQQASDELDVKRELQKRNPGIVPQRDIEKLEVAVAGRQGSLDAATASKQSAMVRVSALLPAEKASAEAALAEAQVDLDKTYIRAGVDGRVEQFFLRPGDIVNPMIRSAGILIPDGCRTARPHGGVWTDRRRRS